ncbi:MAG: Ppx/GppA family phosphatase [Helicobacteraceae bacterium]|nr:Ppx/GppA family phosphatase [Helicobacteraceae bacterium]
MARITAVIDLGSNSARMAIFERTSRYGFHLLTEVKSRVRIGENAYKNGGLLQSAAIERAIGALTDFASIAKSYRARKIIAIATSATRDAPNKAEFLRAARNASGLQIRAIDGKEEARLGGVAAANLLAFKEGVTIDVGGGSTEFALIKEGKIADTISFNLGTVRLKELFFDEKKGAKEAASFVLETLEALKGAFACSRIIGMGGTMRALAMAIIKAESYPLSALHGFSFDVESYGDFLDRVVKSDFSGLKGLGFKSDRFDVIREGTLIFKLAAQIIGAKEALISGAGVREGAFLNDLLRGSGGRLPNDIEPSLVSLLDRFGGDGGQTHWAAVNAARLFDLLKPLHKLDDSRKRALIVAAKLSGTGAAIDPYYPAEQEAALAQNGLSYGFSHADRLLIATLLTARQKKELDAWSPPKQFERFLPEAKTARWLALILFVTQKANAARGRPKIDYSLKGKTLTIAGASYLSREAFSRFKPPFDLEIALI